ncbi:M48 family metallopeptidase [uncultured Thioclava sp.]|jgi:predicted Zn-dependent protease|uniref:M48 family metallopeptidase n=1 Tax=Thioclava arctica TaxID=3238301 RepID=A0ABV3TGB2_9RHOB|nr:M48 family metallopeptidase [uncultured Thioclava sp.]
MTLPRLAARLIPVLLMAVLAGCALPVPPTEPAPLPPISPEVQAKAERAVDQLVSVARRMEPVIETECRARSRGRNCNYRLVVDDRVDLPPNAFQTEDLRGRPVIGVTLAMIAEVHSADELAFVLGHEAAHHIAGHISSRERDAQEGAQILAKMVRAQGADPRTVAEARKAGAEMGSRLFAKDYELEADRLGTIITWDAGYDPLKGAAFFRRLPDPEETVLGTHPANALRLDVVAKTVAELRAGTITGSGGLLK